MNSKLNKSVYMKVSIFLALFCIGTIFFPINSTFTNVISHIQNPHIASNLEPSNSNPNGDKWLMFHKNLEHNGSTETIPKKGYKPLWNFAGSGSLSSPAISNDMVYVGGRNGFIYCLNATTGNLIWNYKIGDSVSSSPAISNGKVYVGSGTNDLYCLDALTGTFIWRFEIIMGTSSSPVISNGMLYIGSFTGNLYCINATTGKLIWNYVTGDGITSSPAISNNMVYVGSFDDNLYCLNAMTGSLIWNYTSGYTISSSPAISNGMVYVGSDITYMTNGYGESTHASSKGKEDCLNATTGSLIWNYSMDGYVESTAAISNGMVYVGSGNDNIYCLNATTGSLIWKYKTGFCVESSPAISNGMVYVGSDDDNLYCLNAKTGGLIWKYLTDGYIESSPAIVNGMVYVGTYCFPMIIQSHTNQIISIVLFVFAVVITIGVLSYIFLKKKRERRTQNLKLSQGQKKTIAYRTKQGRIN